MAEATPMVTSFMQDNRVCWECRWRGDCLSEIESALAANDFHRAITARSLCISVRTLHYKMNKYDLH
ncbi:MAG: helix-turn-helix domain-containing protein [Rubripirellula sp.]